MDDKWLQWSLLRQGPEPIVKYSVYSPGTMCRLIPGGRRHRDGVFKRSDTAGTLLMAGETPPLHSWGLSLCLETLPVPSVGVCTADHTQCCPSWSGIMPQMKHCKESWDLAGDPVLWTSQNCVSKMNIDILFTGEEAEFQCNMIASPQDIFSNTKVLEFVLQLHPDLPLGSPTTWLCKTWGK